MASAARGESSNPYGGGFGAGGKFRKPTGARRSQKTPYDRPPTSARNPRPAIGEEERGGGGWLAKLVDPAQRLVTYSAHRLFASVFRKRLVSGETRSPEERQQIPERDVMQETNVVHRENTSALSMKNDVIRVQEVNGLGNPSKDRFTDLEKVLKEKTFTRSEVDRLTTLLRSKAVDSSTINGDQNTEASFARHPQSRERDRPHPDSGITNALVSTPLRSSRALDECIASPAQLAKAYMCSRPSEVTPMLRSHGQTGRGDSVSLNRTPFPSKSRTMSLVTKLSGQRPMENGFVTPRSRGRSAVYSMARTPYSRPQSTVKNGSLFQASPSTWEESLSSGSRKGFQSGLKRRSSVLATDIGSVGPVRRIRQKFNLSSRSLALPVSESPLSVRSTGGKNMTHTSKDVGDITGSNFNLVPSTSRELASKILQQVDKMVSPKKKSPSKLSPSMLRGPALKSLQNVEAPKFLDNFLPEKKENLPGSSHQKQENFRETGAREFLALSEKIGDAAGDTSKAGSSKDHETCVNGAYLPLTSSVEEHPPKKRAFRMVADKDFDDHGEPSTPFQGAEKQNAFKVVKGVDISMQSGKKPLTSSEVMTSTSYIPNGNASQSTSHGSLETGISQFSALPIEAVQQSNMASEPTSEFIQGAEKSSISPAKLTSEGGDVSREEHTKAAAVFPSTFSSPATTDLLNQNTGQSADIKLEKPSSFAFGKPTESKKTVNNIASGIELTTSAESTLNGSMFSGGANAISQPQINASLGSNPSFPPSILNIPSYNSVKEVPCTVQSFAATPAASSVFGKLLANTSSNDSNSGSNSQSSPAPSLSSTSSFKFGEPFTASTVSSFSDQIIKEAEVKDPIFGNINSFKFSGKASIDTSTENAFAAKSLEIKSKPSFVFESSSSGSRLNPSPAAASAPGSSASLVFGMPSSSAPTLGTESFAASTGSKIFATPSPAFTSPGSSVVTASTASGTFGFNLAASSQSQASSCFGVANAETGTRSGTTTSTQSGPFVFGSSTSAQMGKTGTTTLTQSAPFVFGSSGSAPSFGLSGNNNSSNSSPFGLSKPQPAVFSFSSTPQLSSTNSSASSSGASSSSLFATNWQAPNSAPAFGSSSPTFSFGGSSASTGSNTPAPIFFSSAAPAVPQQSVFSIPAPSTTPSQSPFGNSTPGFFPSNQQVSMEDSMAEDTEQANKALMVQQQPMFGQQPLSSMPQPSFSFSGVPATHPPSMANPFQFGTVQPIAASTQQNPSLFQASPGLEFQGGGSSFSLGSTGGGDKSGRRIFKAKKTNRRR